MYLSEKAQILIMFPKIDYSPMDTKDIRLAKDSWCLRKCFLEVGSLLTLLHFSLDRAEPATACCLLSVNTKRNLKPSILLINTTQCDSFLGHFQCTEEPIKGILNFCFQHFLLIIFQSFHPSAFINHLFLHAVYFSIRALTY